MGATHDPHYLRCTSARDTQLRGTPPCLPVYNDRMDRAIRVAAVFTAGAVLLVGMALTLAELRDSEAGPDSPSPLALDRPEVRTPACPTSAAMEWAGRGWIMRIGPVGLNFPYAVVGPDKEVFAGAGSGRGGPGRPGALYQKIPLNVDAPAGTPFVLRGAELTSGAAMEWDGPSRVSVNVPVSERTFVPGQMVFDAPGCYQLFFELQGESYGPFGFVVRSSNPGEIIATAR